MLQRLADQIGEIITFAIAALIVGIVRLFLLPGDTPIRVYAASFLASIPVGTLTGLLCLENGIPDIASITAASIASLLAHDVLTGLMKNREFFGELLKRAAENITDRWTK